MAEIDYLEIKIQSDAENASKKLDILIGKLDLVAKGISAIGKNSGLQEFSKKIQESTKNFAIIQNAAKGLSSSITPEMQKVSKSFDEIAKDFQNKFKDTPVKVNFSKPEAELEKFKKQAQTAENALSRIMTSSSADKQVKSIEKWSISLAQAQNAVKLLEDHIGGLKSQMESVSKQKATEGIKINGERYIVNFKKELAETKETIEKFKNVYGSLINIPKGMLDRPIEGLTESLAELKSAYPQATNVINDFEQTLKGLQGISENLTKERVVPKVDTSQLGKINKAKENTQEFEEVLNSLRNIQPKINETNLTKLQNRLKTLEEHTEKLRYELEKGLRFENISDKTFENITIKIRESENEADALRKKIEQIENVSGFERIKQSMAGISAAGKQANKAFTSIHAALKKLNNGVNSLFSKIRKLIKSMFSFESATKSTNGSLNISLKNILKYGFGIRSLYVLFNRLRNAAKEAFKNLAQYSPETNAAISSLTSSLGALKNSIATAFAPILNVVAPILSTFIDLLTRAFNAVGRFFAALTGKSLAVQSVKNFSDYAAGISKTGGAAKKAAKDIKTYTLGIDELNIITEDTSEESGAGGGAEILPEDMFETVAIEENIKKFAEKIKEIFSEIFEPLKKAWEKQGQFVINSWKYALKEIGLLSKSIGEDFLEVWNQDKTVAMLENVLIIVGDIGLAVGNIASNFKSAWENNETGKRILENIRDVIAIIISNVKDAADATVEWAKNINFTPLLEAFERVTQSIKPAIDAISGILSDFYTQVLLPLGKWTLEEGLPQLLDVLSDFSNKVDWESLRANLSEFWKHLEPFAEKVGQGLIDFIDDISDSLAGFLNSQEFKDFLTSVENWMDNVSAEDVTNAIKNIAEALIALKVALIGFSAISSVVAVITTIKSFLAFFGASGEGAVIAGNITAISNALGLLGTTLAAMGVISLFDEKFKKFGESLGQNEQQVNTLGERYDGIKGKVSVATDFFSLFQNKLDGFGFNASNTANQIGALEDVMERIGNGTIYTDEQLEKLQKRFGLTDEDIEMLRQSMLDIHPELRNLADNFDSLGSASADTLDDIAGGMEVLSQTTGDYGSVLDMMTGSQSAMTDEAKNFFEELKASSNMEEVINNFKNATNSMDNFSGEMGKAGENAGSGFGEGIKAGFEEKWTEFKNWFVNTGITGFWNDDISPWFTAEKWSELGQGILDGIALKWEEFKLWWSESALLMWWEEHVAPWFTAEKWQTLLDNVKNAFQTKWNEISGQWKTNIKTWWDNNVAPWFTLKKWSDAMTGIVDGFKQTFKNAANSAISIFNNLIDWINEKMHFSWDAITIAGKTIVPSGSVQLFTIPHIPQFELGGFPEDGLFFANHNELVGEFSNGKTAVANNAQIVEGISIGVESAVRSAVADILAPYLADIAQNTRETAEKDLSVVIGDTDIAEANRRGETRLGFNFSPSYA